MECPANQQDDEGNLEDPITYAPLDTERRLQVGQLCYAPESIADWILSQQDISDVYGNELTDRQLLDLLHFLDGRDAERYPRYGKLARLIARSLGITLAYMIYLEDASTPETMTHYSSLSTAIRQANLSTRMDSKLREIGVHAVTNDMRFIAPLQHFVSE